MVLEDHGWMENWIYSLILNLLLFCYKISPPILCYGRQIRGTKGVRLLGINFQSQVKCHSIVLL